MDSKKVVKKSVPMKHVTKEKGSLMQKQRVLTAEGFRRKTMVKKGGRKGS